jgi:hypothetical protein
MIAPSATEARNHADNTAKKAPQNGGFRDFQ